MKEPQVWTHRYKWLPQKLYEQTVKGERTKALLETEINGAASHEHLNRLHHAVDVDTRLSTEQRLELFRIIDHRWEFLSLHLTAKL